MIEQFTQKTQEALNFYVYALVDPSDNKIFYIGKGNANRVFAHINEALISVQASDKLEIIRSIRLSNLKVQHFIIRHGLEEGEAILLESVLIDFLTYKDFIEVAKISNIVSGAHSFNLGIRTADECEILYNCEKLNEEDIKHSILVININKTFDIKRNKKQRDIYSRPNIYEATRGYWRIKEKKLANIEYVLAEYKGIIRALFKPERWYQNVERNNRWGFEGSPVTDSDITDLYLNKEISKIKGMANPLRYFYPQTLS
ncbi:excinuclease ABC [Flavobacterium sp.]|uniref:LEM-3-like GIY-YIG domain-containing protein n=1 Tax=Flavobacterium sp. TaxID=239 RepID=UPI00261A9AB7|nr:excinuclease ABC [Flavobacterium sp.]